MAGEPRYVVNCSMLFTELPIMQRPQAARDAGFEAIEFWWPFPDPVPDDAALDAFVGAVRDAGVHLTALNFTGGDMRAGERGVLSHPGLGHVFRSNVDVAVAIAEALDVRAFNALYGNRIDGVAASAQDDVAVENLAYAGRAAAAVGATVLIEPLSGVASYPLRTAADAVEVIDRVEARTGVTSLRLLADLYHLHVNGDDLTSVIDTYVDTIGHVQLADAPGRGAPGTGEIQFVRHLAHLGRRGYRGNVSLEYHGDGVFAWLPWAQRACSPWD